MKTCKLSILLCLFFSLASAQEMPFMAAKNRVLLHENDTLYQFYTAQTPLKSHIKLNRKYYWYKSDTILATQGSFSGKLLHGSFKSFYPNNNLLQEGNYRYGLKEGTWKEWYPSGLLKSITKWKKKGRKGNYLEYTENSKKLRKGVIKNDLFTGTLWDYVSDGKIKKSIYVKGEKVEKAKTKKQKAKKSKVKKLKTDKKKSENINKDSSSSAPKTKS